jgi:hypothetical protein
MNQSTNHSINQLINHLSAFCLIFIRVVAVMVFRISLIFGLGVTAGETLVVE